MNSNEIRTVPTAQSKFGNIWTMNFKRIHNFSIENSGVFNSKFMDWRKMQYKCDISSD